MCNCASSDEYEGRNLDKIINKQLKTDAFEEKKVKKLLLLGAGASGNELYNNTYYNTV